MPPYKSKKENKQTAYLVPYCIKQEAKAMDDGLMATTRTQETNETVSERYRMSPPPNTTLTTSPSNRATELFWDEEKNHEVLILDGGMLYRLMHACMHACTGRHSLYVRTFDYQLF